MTSKTYVVAVMTIFTVSVTQASAQSAIATGRLGLDVALIATPANEISAKPHYRLRQVHDRHARYRFYHPTLPYDGYRPYPLPIYQCSFYGPIALYPYCWGW